MIKVVFTGMILFILACFILLDSKTVEFNTRTFGQTELSERVSMVPVFHGERLQAYLEQQLETAQEWVRQSAQMIRKPA